MNRIAAVIVAGGEGRRLGGTPKQFRELGGRPMLAWSCARFSRDPWVSDLVVVLPRDIAASPPAWVTCYDAIVVPGGPSRRASVRAGVRAAPEADFVLIHDAARPFVQSTLVRRLIAAVDDGPAVPCVPLADAIKRVDDNGRIGASLDRSALRGAQTPQIFPGDLIRRLHEAAALEGVETADDAELCEREGISVQAIPGDPSNFKVTLAEDFERAEWLVTSGRVRWPGDE